MGGAMALHLAFRFVPEIAGVFALSSFLNDNSVTYQVTVVRFELIILYFHVDSYKLSFFCRN